MPKVHALLVGIDRYQRPTLDLRGCVNDVTMAEQLLRDRIAPGDLAVAQLHDDQATREAIVAAFRRHLGGLGPGDTALFWYSGHGSTGPLPEEIWYAESSGMCQTVVCHDSRASAPDLYDKELAVLAHEVVRSGAHLVTIMDSCHSRSAVRDAVPGLTARLAPAADRAPALHDLLPELVAAAADRDRPVPGRQLPGHVALAACDEWEVANERPFADGWHGVFSEAIGHALARLGPEATYRQVYSHARCRVEGRLSRQVPALEALGDLADLEFLSGALRPRATRITMRRLQNRGRWEVDAGAVHGVVPGARFGVHHVVPLQEVHAVDVRTERSTVDPAGWTPDPEAQYEMVLTNVPLPPVTVSIAADPGVTARLASAVRVSGPGGGPSPHIRVVPGPEADTGDLRLRVRQLDGGDAVQVTGEDNKPLAAPVPVDDDGVEQTVRDLEHIARWLQVRNLPSTSPALEEAVRIEVIPAPTDGSRPLRGSAPPAHDPVFDYRWDESTWVPPEVFIRLHNTTDRRLYCVLLDLTDRYRIHPELFPGEHIEARWTAEAGNGAPIALTLPPHRPVEPGACGMDWLVLLVAEEPFSSGPFWLPGLREVSRSPLPDARSGLTGVLDRLGLIAVRRDVRPVRRTPARDWAVKVVELTTRVPAMPGGSDDPGTAV